MTPDALRDEILRLSPEARFELLADVWDSIAAHPDAVPIPDWHRDVLADRIAEPDPNRVPWAEAKRSLREDD
ncbi:MAG: addiction module protein [Rhodothermales bacterium]|nr:addiction module protein [Rhodothermales bacterium]